MQGEEHFAREKNLPKQKLESWKSDLHKTAIAVMLLQI